MTTELDDVIAKLERERDRIDGALKLLKGDSYIGIAAAVRKSRLAATAKNDAARAGKRTMSEATRAKLRAKAKAMWARRRAAAKTTKKKAGA